MLYPNARLVGTHLLVIDAAVFSIFSVAYLQWGVGVELSSGRFANLTPGLFLLASLLVFIGVGGRLDAYHARRTERLAKEIASLVEVTLYSSVFSMVLAQLLSIAVSPAAMLTVVATTIGFMVALRLSMRLLIRHLRAQGKDQKNWLIIGSNPRAEKLIELVNANPHFGICVRQVVDLQRGGTGSDAEVTEVAGTHPVRHLRSAGEIRQILKQEVIDEVVITLPVRSYYDEIQEIIGIGRELGNSTMLQPDSFDDADARSKLTISGNLPMVAYFTGPSNLVQLGIKRLIDIVVSFASLILLVPLFLAISIWIKLDSPGPVLFRSTRIGLHGRQFQMVKFRSMVENAPALREAVRSLNETDGVAFKIKDDPRVTPVGRILRAYHLDELAQLWNVLVGDMSLVGPRPLPEAEAHGREWWHIRRLSMPPGLTCHWQIAGDHKMPFREWAALDLKYIDNWSLWLDMKLMAETMVALLRRPGW